MTSPVGTRSGALSSTSAAASGADASTSNRWTGRASRASCSPPRAAPTPTLVGSLLARSEGNPLYAEELLGADSDVVPGALGDLLLARVDALSGRTVELLRLASVNGARIDSALLAEVSGDDEREVDSALREALDANVLAQVRP